MTPPSPRASTSRKAGRRHRDRSHARLVVRCAREPGAGARAWSPSRWVPSFVVPATTSWCSWSPDRTERHAGRRHRGHGRPRRRRARGDRGRLRHRRRDRRAGSGPGQRPVARRAAPRAAARWTTARERPELRPLVPAGTRADGSLAVRHAAGCSTKARCTSSPREEVAQRLADAGFEPRRRETVGLPREADGSRAMGVVDGIGLTLRPHLFAYQYLYEVAQPATG